MAGYGGLTSKAYQISKGFAGDENDKAQSVVKIFVGDENDKAQLIWSGFTPKYLALTRSSVTGYSEDGIAWDEGSIPATSSDSCTFGLGKYFFSSGTKVYYSEDGIAWTLSHTFDRTICLLRYCNDGYVYAFGYVSSSSDWIWRTKDGVTWEGITLNLSTYISDSSAYKPLDFQYCVVGGTAAYYFLFERITGVFKVESMTGGTFTRIYKSWNPSKGALYICGGVLYVLEQENSGTPTVVYNTNDSGGLTQIISIAASLSYAVGTSNGLLLVTSGKATYLVSNKTYVQKTTFPNPIVSTYTIFACAWDGGSRVVIMGRSNIDVYTMRCTYTDDFGETWTTVDITMSGSMSMACGCYGIDGGGYYSE